MQCVKQRFLRCWINYFIAHVCFKSIWLCDLKRDWIISNYDNFTFHRIQHTIGDKILEYVTCIRHFHSNVFNEVFLINLLKTSDKLRIIYCASLLILQQILVRIFTAVTTLAVILDKYILDYSLNTTKTHPLTFCGLQNRFPEPREGSPVYFRG